MVDQVNPTGGLAAGTSLAPLMAAIPSPAPAKPRTSKPADAPAPGHGAGSSVESTETAVQQVNGHLQQAGSELKIQVDQATGRSVFKVVNPNDGKVVLQVPSEEMLALARNVRAMEKDLNASGVLIDKQG